MKISVIIPCYNCATMLPAQLEALSGQNWEDGWEVIVADNGSRDRSITTAKKFRESLPGLRVIRAADRRGYAHARNAAVEKASGEALLFCDGNDIVSRHWLATMGNALRKSPFVAGRLVVSEINPDWTIQARPDGLDFQSAGVLTNFGYLPWASSSNMGIRRHLFHEIGGFNELMPALEDIDFSWRIQQRGTKLLPVNDSVVHYRLRKTYAGIFHQALLHAENFVLLCKHYKSLGFSPPVPSRASLATEWLRLAARSLWCPNRGVWMWQAGWRFGCVTGSLKHRYLLL